jgi:hypothetical protein
MTAPVPVPLLLVWGRARLVRCDNCPAEPDQPCQRRPEPDIFGVPLTFLTGMHLGRFARAARKGLISDRDLAAVYLRAGWTSVAATADPIRISAQLVSETALTGLEHQP